MTLLKGFKTMKTLVFLLSFVFSFQVLAQAKSSDIIAVVEVIGGGKTSVIG